MQNAMKNLKWEFAEGIFQAEVTVPYYPMKFRCVLKSTGKEMTAQVTQVYFAHLRTSPATLVSESAETYSDGQALEKLRERLTEQISVLVDEIEELGITEAILKYQEKIAYFYGKKSA